MKKLATIIFAVVTLFTAINTDAQTPQAFKYQAAVRDSANEIISNQAMGIRAAIIADSTNGSVIYQENHATHSNEFGLINIIIGAGTSTIGSFANIDWSAGPLFMKIEADETGGSNYQHLSTSELSSVPYALFAQSVANDAVDDADADTTNELQTLSISGNSLHISNGNTVVIPVSADNLGNHTATQSIRLNGQWLTHNGFPSGLYIDNNNRIGIGTQWPLEELTVNGTIGSAGGFRFPDGTIQYMGSYYVMQNLEINNNWISNHGDPDGIYIDIMDRVGIGTELPSEKLHVVGNICYTGSSSSCSDLRYKKDITILPNVLEKLEQINGVSYNWRVEEFPEKGFEDKTQIGVIAQELEQAYPELVITDANGYKTVDYPKLTAVLIEAVKSQQKQITDYEQRITNHESRITELEAIKAMLGLEEQVAR